MTNNGITLDPGDIITVDKDEQGYWAVRIYNRIWDEERWLRPETVTTHDGREQLLDLADALRQLVEIGQKEPNNI